MAENDNWLVHDHRRFEMTLKECEFAAGAQDWKTAEALFTSLVDDLKLHMRMEDEVVYPFFCQEQTDPNNDIGDLMYEHETMARLLNDLATVVRNKDFDHFEESLTPLYEAMVVHNAHEEAVLSRLENDSLLAHRDEILKKLAKINPAFSRDWTF